MKKISHSEMSLAKATGQYVLRTGGPTASYRQEERPVVYALKKAKGAQKRADKRALRAAYGKDFGSNVR